jgi:hypothetical protein
VGLFTIWPETYSHTLSESWACGVPVLGSELGAIGTRLARHGGGWSVDTTNVEAIYAMILRIATNPAEYREQEQRARISNLQTVAEMAGHYRYLYKEKIAAKRKAEGLRASPQPVRVVVVTPPAQTRETAALMRVLQHPALSLAIDVVQVGPKDVMQERVARMSRTLLVAPAEADRALTAALQRYSDQGCQVMPAAAVLKMFAVPSTAPATPRLIDERMWLWTADQAEARRNAGGEDLSVALLMGQTELPLTVSLVEALKQKLGSKTRFLLLAADGATPRLDGAVRRLALPTAEQAPERWALESGLAEADLAVLLMGMAETGLGSAELALMKIPTLTLASDKDSFAELAEQALALVSDRAALREAGMAAQQACLTAEALIRNVPRVMGMLSAQG